MIRGGRALKTCGFASTLLALVACGYMSQGFRAPVDRGAKPSPNDPLGDHTRRIVYVDQGWDETDSLWFYNTTQGSNLLPYELFLHLEQASSTQAFRDDANMLRYRYLLSKPTWDNPDALPVGFVKDTYRGRAYVGLTCAACHTGQLDYGEVGIRIDGGPALADLQGFLEGLEASLAATLRDEAKFRRLAAAVQGTAPAATYEQRAKLRTELATWHARLSGENRQNHGGVPRYGYGRVDAFGRIFNRVFTRLTPDDPHNTNPSNAPVSYPFLWDTPLHDYVQWNGLISNEKNQVAARNVGEALGSFASFDLDTGASSVVLPNLNRMERQLREKLWSPLWPAVLPAIDPKRAAQGRKVFERYRCGTCHEPIGDRESTKRRVVAQLISLPRVGTDPTMARNAATLEGLAGLIEGEPYANSPGRHGRTTPAHKALGSAIKRVITRPDPDRWFLRRWWDLGYELATGLLDTTIKNPSRHVDHVPVGNRDVVDDLLVYKARPLNGIWATAPYLHNGSVPNLYELFLPSCAEGPPADPGTPCRSRSFTVGSRRFDPVKVGFETPSATKRPALFVFDATLPGNSNAGHEYAAGVTPVMELDPEGRPARGPDGAPRLAWLPPISEDDRWALVEYLKTL
ncbi:MAG: hypothetical protein KA712_11775 [Myxococcales bacterium]|nr:hypothetical protein [Myxococcales bacterium]